MNGMMHFLSLNMNEALGKSNRPQCLFVMSNMVTLNT